MGEKQLLSPLFLLTSLNRWAKIKLLLFARAGKIPEN
jgi:hypothetical protein